jgi:hypothetical protein
MTNKLLYNIVFERFVQAKKELIREGYHKNSLDKVDFNEVFSKTKHQLQEAKIKSLMRENQMLRRKLYESSYRAGGQGSQYQGNAPGSETLWNGISNIMSPFSVTAMADKVARQLVKQNILQDDDDISKFKIKYIGFRKKGLKNDEAIGKAMSELEAQNAPTPQTLAESKRRRLQKEGMFDMFGKKGGQQAPTQQREPKQVWLETLTKVFGSDFVNQNLSKMDDKSLSDFFKPINNLFIEGGGGPIFSGLMDVLERTDGVNFKNLNQDYFRPLSSQLMLLNQFMNLFKIIETKFGNMENTMITSLYKSNVTNPTQKEVLSQLVKKSKESGQPISKVLDLISTYAKPTSQNLAESKRRKY